jgi:hypothetical protein
MANSHGIKSRFTNVQTVLLSWLAFGITHQLVTALVAS